MGPNASTSETAGLTLRSVDSENWRDVAKLEVTEAQLHFIAAPTYYLSLCCYGAAGWQPLAVQLGEQVVGFLMWAADPDDGSCWLGGIHIDRAFQGRGYGKKIVRMALSMLSDEHGFRQFALSYQPANIMAKRLYAGIGFVETDERADGEDVARLSVTDVAGTGV